MSLQSNGQRRHPLSLDAIARNQAANHATRNKSFLMDPQFADHPIVGLLSSHPGMTEEVMLAGTTGGEAGGRVVSEEIKLAKACLASGTVYSTPKKNRATIRKAQTQPGRLLKVNDILRFQHCSYMLSVRQSI